VVKPKQGSGCLGWILQQSSKPGIRLDTRFHSYFTQQQGRTSAPRAAKKWRSASLNQNERIQLTVAVIGHIAFETHLPLGKSDRIGLALGFFRAWIGEGIGAGILREVVGIGCVEGEIDFTW
jgi:hypothetical protein